MIIMAETKDKITRSANSGEYAHKDDLMWRSNMRNKNPTPHKVSGALLRDWRNFSL